MKRFFWAKQTDTETLGDLWEKIFEMKRERDFPEFSTKILTSKSKKPITERKLPERKYYQAAERKRFRCTESSRTNTTKYKRQKEQEEYHT